MLKWAGALAAVGVVGVGLGFGADILIRPSTTTTKTSVSTQAVTATATDANSHPNCYRYSACSYTNSDYNECTTTYYSFVRSSIVTLCAGES